MKSKIFLSAFLLLHLVFSCKKEPVSDIISTTNGIISASGTITGLKINGNNWPLNSNWIRDCSGYIINNKNNHDTACLVPPFGCFNIDSFEGVSSPGKEDLLVSGIPLKTGRFVLQGSYIDNCPPYPEARLALMAEDGDVLAGYFVRLPTVESSITIMSYDTTTGAVSGTFDITLVKDGSLNRSYPEYATYPDTVHFSGGTFKTKWLK